MLRCREVSTGTEPPSRVIHQVFAQARRLTPSVLVLDDLDVLDDVGALAVVKEVGSAADRSGERAPLLVIGTATRLDRIDELLTRAGLLRPLQLLLPDFAARQELAAHYAQRYDLSLSPELREAVARASDGFSCEDMRSVFLATRINLLAGHDTAVAEKLGAEVGAARRALQQGHGSSPPTLPASRTERANVTLAVPQPEVPYFGKQSSEHNYGLSKHAPARVPITPPREQDRSGELVSSDDDQ